jgi:aromatic-L-amino-acid decarboxylase
LAAIIAAREATGREEIVCSEQTHSSVDKAARMLGMRLRRVPVDPEFRMRTDALGDLSDAAVIVATVGTTAVTAVDPVPALAEACAASGAWLHVDAAYAGAAAILPECQHILDSVERAHSLVMNPHKWLFTNIDLSAFYTRCPDILRRAFSLVPEYLRASDDPRAIHLMDYGVPLGHRFRALKLWFILRYFGRQRLQQLLRSHMEWSRRIDREIQSDARFEVVAPVPFSVVCFRYKGSDDDNRRILEEVNASGKFFISHTELGGRYVLRLAIGNLGTTWEDVQGAWEMIQGVVRR